MPRLLNTLQLYMRSIKLKLRKLQIQKHFPALNSDEHVSDTHFAVMVCVFFLLNVACIWFICMCFLKLQCVVLISDDF